MPQTQQPAFRNASQAPLALNGQLSEEEDIVVPRWSPAVKGIVRRERQGIVGHELRGQWSWVGDQQRGLDVLAIDIERDEFMALPG